MNDNAAKDGKPGGHGHCSQAVMLFYAVLLLVACFAAAMIAGGWFLVQGLMLPGIAWLIAASYLLLVLIGVAAAALVLRVMRCCVPTLYRSDCGELPPGPSEPRPEKA